MSEPEVELYSVAEAGKVLRRVWLAKVAGKPLMACVWHRANVWAVWDLDEKRMVWSGPREDCMSFLRAFCAGFSTVSRLRRLF